MTHTKEEVRQIIIQTAHDRYLEQLAGTDLDESKSLEELISEADYKEGMAYDNENDR